MNANGRTPTSIEHMKFWKIKNLSEFEDLIIHELCCHIDETCTVYIIIKVQMKCFFIAEFDRAAKIRKIAVYRFLMSLLVPEL